MDVQCSIDLEWNSTHGSGNIRMARCNVSYAALGTLTDAGVAPTPETLLIAAISSSYSIALSNVLRAASLPQTGLSVCASGTIGNNCGKTCFTHVTVSPTIEGADLLRRHAYESAARAARNECLVGRSVRGNVAYVVGQVALRSMPQS